MCTRDVRQEVSESDGPQVVERLVSVLNFMQGGEHLRQFRVRSAQLEEEADNGEPICVLLCLFHRIVLAIHVNDVQLCRERAAIERVFRAPAVAQSPMHMKLLEHVVASERAAGEHHVALHLNLEAVARVGQFSGPEAVVRPVHVCGQIDVKYGAMCVDVDG